MAAAVDQSSLKRTQDLLGKYITKPPLTPKLLSKPPFRFLHDVIRVLITERGIFDGLYSPEDLSSDNIKDKDAKIAFLEKIINATAFATGESYTVRPNKIVAGHEADKTNEWLQGIAKALNEQIDTSEAVQQVLAGSKPAKPKKDKDKSNKREKDKDKTNRGKDDKGRRKDKDKEGESSKSRERRSKDKDKDKKSKDKEDKKRDKRRDKTKEKKDHNDDNKENEIEAKENLINGATALDDLATEPLAATPPETEAEATESAAEILETNGSFSPKPGPSEPFTLDEPHIDGPSIVDPIQVTDGDMSLPTQGELSMDQLGEAEPTPLDDPGIGSGPASLLQIQNGSMSPTGADPTPAQEPEITQPNNEPEIPVPNVQPDSGVGSLESPKVPTEPTPSPPPPAAEPEAPKSPPKGPAPLKAMEQFEGLPPAIDPQPEPPSDIPMERPKTGGGVRPRTGLRSARPPSARPAPPKVRERREIPKDELPRPPTSKPVANVILDSSTTDPDNEDDNFVVDNSKPIIDELEDAGIASTMNNELSEEQQKLLGEGGEGAGLLVTQILEAKKELEDDRKIGFTPETPGHRRVEIEKTPQSDAARKKEREAIQKEIQMLSSSIQTLTRSVNPLAKMLDYLQEDLDSMQKELETWTNENRSLEQTLKSEESNTETSLEPLKTQLVLLDDAIYEKQDQISSLKASIVRNSARTSRLMAGINV